MNLLKKITITVLILSVFSLNLPAWVFAKQDIMPAKKKITEHEPMILTTPEVNIPIEKKAFKKVNKWVWIGIGALAVGGAAAFAASGGSDDGDNQLHETDNGNVTISW